MRFPNKGHLFLRGRLLITTLTQAAGAPFADRAWSYTKEGGRYEGRAILLTPWRRDGWGEARSQRALFVGFRRFSHPDAPTSLGVGEVSADAAR